MHNNNENSTQKTGDNLSNNLKEDFTDTGIEEKISKFIQNVIDIKKIPVTKKFTDIEKVILIDLETPINKSLMLYYVNKGISRIPVTRNNNRNDIIGYVRTIDFLKLEADLVLNESFTIKDKIMNIHLPHIVEPSCNLYDLFSNFRNGNHMALITDDKNSLERSVKIYNENLLNILDKSKRNNEFKIIGIVTLEDILESLIEADIKDESEKDLRKKKRASKD